MARWFNLRNIRSAIRGIFQRPEPVAESPNYWGQPLEDIYSQVDAKRFDYSDEMSPTDAQEGRDLFYAGWVDKSIDKDEREEARERFKDWMSEWDVPSDFPWDDWREWYEENAA